MNNTFVWSINNFFVNRCAINIEVYGLWSEKTKVSKDNFQIKQSILVSCTMIRKDNLPNYNLHFDHIYKKFRDSCTWIDSRIVRQNWLVRGIVRKVLTMWSKSQEQVYLHSQQQQQQQQTLHPGIIGTTDMMQHHHSSATMDLSIPRSDSLFC